MKNEKRKQPKIVMHGTKTYIWCDRTREFFKEHKIKYKEINIGSNSEAAEKMIKNLVKMGCL